MSNFLSGFSHISSQVPGLKALVSVQIPPATGFEAITSSISSLFGSKRAAYLALTNSGLCHVITSGSSVVKKTEIAESSIDKVRISNGSLPDFREVSLPQVALTTKKINIKKVKEGGETKMQEVPEYTEYDFTLFPVTFGPNLKYSQSAEEIHSSTEMRKNIIAYLQGLGK